MLWSVSTQHNVQLDSIFIYILLPQSDGSGHRVIAMYDREHPLHKFIHIENLFQMFLTLLGYFQYTEAQKVIPETRETCKSVVCAMVKPISP